ncbi:MAG TPA: dual specificity protein phosphatase family protein [Ktedonobacterales bacterium]
MSTDAPNRADALDRSDEPDNEAPMPSPVEELTDPHTDPLTGPATGALVEVGEQVLHREAERVEQENPEVAVPPQLSGRALLRKGFARWAVMGGIRWLYRRWTRVAVHVFPEGSRRAAVAQTLGVPLPDQLNLSWITPSLAVGGRIHRDDIARLARSGVTSVVDTRSEDRDEEGALAAHSIAWLYLPTPDTHPLSVEDLVRGATWINEQIGEERRVLVHCEHGVGRSVLLAAASLVAAGMGAHEAIDLIKRRRWQAAPNHRQMKRLQEFEQLTHGAPTGAESA